MTDPITAVTTALSLSKQLLGFAVAVKDANAKLAIAEIQVQLAEIKTRLAELIDENNQLKQDLKAATSTIPEVVIKEGLYYTPDGDGPFCTACYDTKKQLVRLSELGAAFHVIARWKCNVCNGKYGGKQ